MKKAIFMVMAAGVFLQVHGATQLKLTLSNGATPSYTLSEKPQITFEGKNMLITTKEASTTYPRQDVVMMSFTESSSAIQEIDSSKESFSYINGVVNCPDSYIHVYDMNGNMLVKGYDTLSLTDLAAGFYIIKTPNHTVKIAR